MEKTNETKVCKHCQTEISKKAKVCPNCRKKQGGIGKWIVIAVVVFLIIGVAGGGSDDDGTASSGNTGTTNNSNTTNNDSGKDTKTENVDSNVIKAGDSFEVDGLKITVNSCNLNYTDYEDEYGWYAPEDGMKYISVSFTYENNDDTDKYASIYDYDCYADGTLCEETYYFSGDFINANLSSGRNVSFETFYVIPEDAQKIELEYTENVWTSEKVIITLQ